MIMIMNFRIMSGMVMIVRSVVPSVIMVVHVRITTMRVLMFVLMEIDHGCGCVSVRVYASHPQGGHVHAYVCAYDHARAHVCVHECLP